MAGVQTLAQLVSIKVHGDPKLPETRELMHAALDCGLPDRLVLGPGAGNPADASPRVQVCLGSRCFAPISDVERAARPDRSRRPAGSLIYDVASQGC